MIFYTSIVALTLVFFITYFYNTWIDSTTWIDIAALILVMILGAVFWPIYWGIALAIVAERFE